MPFSPASIIARPRTPRAAVGWRGRLAGAALCLLVGLSTTDRAQANSTVAVRSGLHESYGRLVFDWPKPVRFEASVDGNRLVVRFDEPLTIDVGAAAFRRLDGYLTHPSLAADRHSIAFDMVRPFTIKSFQNEHSAVIDMTPQRTGAVPAVAAAAPPAPAPEAKSELKPETRPDAKADAKPPPRVAAVPVRVGEHDDFTRLKFEWPQSVEYRVESDAGRAKITFDKPAQIDLAALRNALPRSVADAELLSDGGGLSFNIPRNAQLRHFRNGLAVVVDVMAPPNATAVAPAASPATAVAVAAPAAPAPQPVAPAAVATPTPATPTPATPTPATSTPAAPEPVAAARSPLSIAAAAQQTDAAAPAADAKLPEIKPVSTEPPQTVVVTFAGSRIRMGWRQMPAAAVFVRGNAAYILFDRPAKFNLSAFNPSNKKPTERMAPPDVIEVNGGSGLRFTVPANINPQPVRENDAWSLYLRNEARRPQSAAAVTIEATTAEGPRVAVAMSGGEGLLTFTDPERGEPLRVVPVRTAGLGVEAGRQFAQFDILQSNQGLVVMPRADGIALRQTASNIVVGGQGLALSRTAAATPVAARGTNAVFDFQRWLGSDVDFTETHQMLQRADADALIASDAARLASSRFELAQFLLARGHAADAIGVLNVVAADNPRYASDPQLKALRGAAQVMLEDGPAAKRDLSDPQLGSDGATLLWRAAATAQSGGWSEADQMFRRAGQVPTTYPPAMRRRLLLLAAEAALEAGDSGRVRALLDGMQRGEVPARARAQADYLRARALIASDDHKGAEPVLQRLAASGDPWARAHGEFLLVDQQLADEGITPAEAIDRLEKLRFVWTGDALEYKLLRRLGDLQIEYGDVRSGLMRLRDAISHFPANPDNAAVRARMTDTFASVYDENGPRKLPPLTALALYDDFRDLTPPGPRGDKMIQNLADRLVSMDLLDRAGELLDYQIKNRLSGTEKARVGARLAVVELLDRKPEAAIAAIDASEAPKLSPELTAERLHLKARAVAETGDSAAALALLEGDTGRDADQLRAEVYVKSLSWSKAAQTLDRLIGDPSQGAFDAARRRQVLNLAVAYALAGDAEGLRSVRDRFGDKMNSGATKDAFSLVTSITEGGAISDKALSARFADLQEFQQFMKGYQEKLRSASLSRIN